MLILFTIPENIPNYELLKAINEFASANKFMTQVTVIDDINLVNTSRPLNVDPKLEATLNSIVTICGDPKENAPATKRKFFTEVLISGKISIETPKYLAGEFNAASLAYISSKGFLPLRNECIKYMSLHF